jgi:choline-sulfatase
MTQPNILLFMVDQLTSFVLSSYGGTVCKTPNIDALAQQGVVFDNAYCPYPLCAPSRFGMMSGRLPSTIGAYDNGAEFPAAIPTFAHYLRLNNYYTCISGKMHFVGPDQYHGFEERLTTEIYPADMSWTPTPDFRDFNANEERGYTFGVSTIDTVKDAGPIARSMQIDYDEDVVYRARRELYARARSDDDRPFMMTVSLTQPHDPYVTTRQFWDLYPDDAIDSPRVPFIPVEQRDPHSQSLYYHYGQDKCELSEHDYRRARRGYYGMISSIDSLLGELLDTLNECDFADNTAVIFSSDHGDMIGERGMWFKKTLFNPAIQIPLVIKHPHAKPARVSGAASLLDLFPTVLEMVRVYCQLS